MPEPITNVQDDHTKVSDILNSDTIKEQSIAQSSKSITPPKSPAANPNADQTSNQIQKGSDIPEEVPS